jgi:hypothetical protein
MKRAYSRVILTKTKFLLHNPPTPIFPPVKADIHMNGLRILKIVTQMKMMLRLAEVLD